MKKTIFAFGALAALFLVSGVGAFDADVTYGSGDIYSSVSAFYNQNNLQLPSYVVSTQSALPNSFPDNADNWVLHNGAGFWAGVNGWDREACANGRCTQQLPRYYQGYDLGASVRNYYSNSYTPTYTQPSWNWDYDYYLSNSYNTVNSHNTDNSQSYYSYNYGGGGCCYYGYCYC